MFPEVALRSAPNTRRSAFTSPIRASSMLQGPLFISRVPSAAVLTLTEEPVNLP
jgi:hypothetical protein